MKILITGATSGIGYETGVNLLKKGHYVYFTVHREKQVKTVVEKLKAENLLSQASVFSLDITKENDRKLIYDLEIDCLICNASVGYGGSILDIPISSLEKNFQVNVFSNIKLIQMYCGHLFLTKKKGKVVVMSSLAGIIPIPFLGSYCATKASLISLTTCLKQELKLLTPDIKIKLIEPGIYNTGFNEVMIDNKKESQYFKEMDSQITSIETKLFHWVGHNNYHSIVRKITQAVESNSNKLIYSAPFFQKVGAKIYSLFPSIFMLY